MRQTDLQSTFQTPLPLVCITLTFLQQHRIIILSPMSTKAKDKKDFCQLYCLLVCLLLIAGLLTSTSPVRSLYLSLMTGRVAFSFRVLDRSLNGCSGAGDGGERPISFSPRLWLRLWEPEVETGDRSGMNNKRKPWKQTNVESPSDESTWAIHVCLHQHAVNAVVASSYQTSAQWVNASFLTNSNSVNADYSH